VGGEALNVSHEQASYGLWFCEVRRRSLQYSVSARVVPDVENLV
jgi:hypothetical protein